MDASTFGDILPYLAGVPILPLVLIYERAFRRTSRALQDAWVEHRRIQTELEARNRRLEAELDAERERRRSLEDKVDGLGRQIRALEDEVARLRRKLGEVTTS